MPLFCALGLTTAASAQWVMVDPSFAAGAGPDDNVTVLALDSADRALISGLFTNVNGVPRPFLARLNADGSTDETFRTRLDHRIARLQPLTDGRLLISGGFSSIGGVPLPSLARLNGDGSRDTGFAPAPAIPEGPLTGVAAPDGRVYVTGAFTSLGGLARYRLARLLENGAVDPSFEAPFGPDDRVSVLAVQADGKPIISGRFNRNPELPATNPVRLNPDGSVDPGFRPELDPTWSIQGGLLQPDGRLLLVVQTPSSAPLSDNPEGLVRLNPDGSLDPGFYAGLGFPGALVDGMIRALALQPDGKLLIGGLLRRVNGTPRAGLARLHPDGRLDHCFQVPFSSELYVVAMAVDSAGGIWIVHWSQNLQGRATPYVARLLPPPACDPAEIEFATLSVQAHEDAPAVVVPLVRRGGADREQTIGFTIRPGAAEAGTNHEAVSGQVRFAPGERSQFIRVPLRRDRLVEGAETFEVVLDTPGEGVTLGAQTRATVTLTKARPGSAGAPDTNYVVSLDGPVRLIQPLADGSVVIAGDFMNVHGVFCPNVARLRPDGSRDETFTRSQPLTGWLNALAVDAAGRVLVGGSFQTVDGRWRPGLARFGTDGVLDTGFGPFDDWPTNQTERAVEVHALTLLPDGDIVCTVSAWTASGAPLVKLSSSGAVDAAFQAAQLEGIVATALAPSPDGGLLVSGAGFGGALAHLSAEGRLELSFVPPVERRATPSAAAMEILPNGQMVLAETRGWPSGSPESAPLWRANPDGSADRGFAMEAAFGTLGELISVDALSAGSDGRVLLAGRFAGVGEENVVLARRHQDGSPDGSFDPGAGFTPRQPWDYTSVRALRKLPSGGWLVGGDFDAYDGFNQPFLVKLLPESLSRPLRFEFATPDLALSEADGPITLEVRRRGDASAPASVTLHTENGSAVAGTDFEPLELRLEFAAGEWTKTVPLRLINDPLVEEPEQFSVRLAEPTTGYALGAAAVTVEIESDDVGVEFIADEFAAIEEDGYALAAIRWSGAVTSNLQATITAVPITGSAEDLVETSFLVPENGSPQAGQTNWFRIGLVDDAVREGIETFRLDLVPADRVTPGAVPSTLLVVQDRDFLASPARGVAGMVAALADAPNGGVYLAGDFTGVHGVPRQRVARLLPDGGVDPAFDPGPGPDGNVTALAVQADGKLVIAGDFTAVSGIPRAGVAKLRPDGSVDSTFDPGLGAQADQTTGGLFIHALWPQPDGALLVAGAFASFDGHPSRLIARLGRDGRVDKSFASPFVPQFVFPYPIVALDNSVIHSLVARSDGRVLVAGQFLLSAGPRPQFASMARLLADGQLDVSFAKLLGGPAWALAGTADGRLLVGGVGNSFVRPGGEADAGASWLAVRRFLADGTPDPTFKPRNVPPLQDGLLSEIRQLRVQTDGRVLFVAAIRALPLSGPLEFARIGRLMPDGAWDESFEMLTCALPATGPVAPGFPTGLIRHPLPPFAPAPPAPTAALAAQPDDVLVVAGAFDAVNGEPRRRLARLDPNGALRGRLRLDLSAGAPFGLRVPGEIETPYVIETSTDLRGWWLWLENEQPWWPLELPLQTDAPTRFFRARSMP